MNYFFDTSALIKNYIEEKGSQKVEEILKSADSVFVSSVTVIEESSTLRRLLNQKMLTLKEYELISDEIKFDLKYFHTVPLDDEIINLSIDIIIKFQLKTLDSIQLACAIALQNEIANFVCCDLKLNNAAAKAGLKVINPAD